METLLFIVYCEEILRHHQKKSPRTWSGHWASTSGSGSRQHHLTKPSFRLSFLRSFAWNRRGSTRGMTEFWRESATSGRFKVISFIGKSISAYQLQLQRFEGGPWPEQVRGWKIKNFTTLTTDCIRRVKIRTLRVSTNQSPRDDWTSKLIAVGRRGTTQKSRGRGL